MSKAIIISGFPGIGKTHFSENNKKYKISDSDSSKFSWLEEGIRDPDFPNNYMEHIKENLDKYDIIFVSSHKTVRDALLKHKFTFTMVYPDISLKEEYLERYRKRGNDKWFIQMISENWDSFIKDIEETCHRLGVDGVVLTGKDRYFEANDSIYLRVEK